MKAKQDAYSDRELEKHIRQKDKELKSLARKLAIHYASRGLPRPNDDSLTPFIGPLKSGYEALANHSLQILQPETLHPEIKMDAEQAEENDSDLQNTIREKTAKNRNDAFELHDYSPESGGARIRLTLLLTIGLLAGDTVWNTTSFQVTGVSLLFSLFLSLMLSLAIFIASHLLPILYKQLTTTPKRRLFVLTVMVGATGVFYVLALFRAAYLAHFGVILSPWSFVAINLFFFTVSTLLSFYLLPDWEEVKLHWYLSIRNKNIKRRDKEIIGHQKERMQLRAEITEKTKLNIRREVYARRLVKGIRQLYFEALEIFKSTNQIYRTDNQIPLCFKYPLPEPDIDNSQIPLISFKPNNK